MLDETLPPGGDTGTPATAPAHDTTTPVPAADAVAPAGPAEATTPEAAVERDAPDDAGAGAAAAAAPAEAGAAAEAVAPAPAADMSPAACAAQLAERFPALFAAGRALPIKLRVQVDIQARAPGVFTRKAMSLFLHRYTTSTAYLKALVSSPHRFDLDGAPAGEVAPEHREAAQIELQRRQAIVQEKRSAQRRIDRPPRPGQGARGSTLQAGAQTAADAAAAAAAPLPAPAGGRPAREGERPRGPRPDARPRPPQTQGPRRDDRRPMQGGPAAGAMPRQDRAAGPQSGPRPPRPAMPRRDGDEIAAGQAPRAEHPPRPSLPPAEIEARRERAALLRSYESSTLTKANFCVLKRLTETDLDAQLALARSEQQAQRRSAVIDPPPRR